MNVNHYTYRVTWSPEDGEFVGACAELPSLRWLADTPGAALTGIRTLASQIVEDLRAGSEPVPTPLSDRSYSGQFKVRIPPRLHRALVLEAAEEGISLNRLASDKLAAGR